MTLFLIKLQLLDDDGKFVDGHAASSVLDKRQLAGEIDWLAKSAESGELNAKREDERLVTLNEAAHGHE